MNASQKPPPIVSDLVLIGGGHAHVHVLKMLGMPQYRQILIDNGIRVTLIAKDIHTPYSGMLPGFVSGHYTYEDIHIDLRKLCRFSNIQLIAAACTKIEYNGNNGGGWVWCNDGRPPLRYDVLSLDIGSAPGATDQSLLKHPRVIPVKPIANFCQFYQRLQNNILQNAKQETKTKEDDNNTTTKSTAASTYRVCVVGGGAGGVELALSIQYNLKTVLSKHTNKKLQMVLVTRGTSILSEHNSRVQQKFQRILQERQFELHLGCEVMGVQDIANATDGNTTQQSNMQSLSSSSSSSSSCSQCLILKNSKKTIPFDDCFVCTSASGSSWLSQNTPFECNEQGFVKVNAQYQVVPGVFAAGDCCDNIDHPRPKAGVFAVRAGPPLFENIITSLLQHPMATSLKPHKPQFNFLSLISTGDQNAIASKGNYLCLEGKYIWYIKDYIDRAFMDKFTKLPDMTKMIKKSSGNSRHNTTATNGDLPPSLLHKSTATQQAFAADPMRCGGCGAKVGSTSLSRVLRQLHKRQVLRAREQNLPIPPPMDHDDAAITPISSILVNGDNGIPKNAAMVHTIDYFRALLEDPYVFGKIVTVHALSDIHAMGAVAQSALSLAVIPFAADDEIVESTLLQLLSGMSDVLQDENVQMIGGHTCEGMELSCGLSIQGYTPDAQNLLLRKRGGKVGDRIVITKPIGTGALFALDMRAKAKGEYYWEAISSMQQSNGPASRVAVNPKYGVRACTDVTGFGLLGHLLEMIMANDDFEELEGIGAKIQINHVPMLRGGLEASSLGVFSSLQPQNARTRRAVKNHTEAAKLAPIRYPLLFDPQTAGGLLMFVDPSKCMELLSALEAEGVQGATVIGELVEAPKQASSPSVPDSSYNNGDGDDGYAVCTLSGTTAKRIEIEL